jgi:hypothetical protein
MYILDVFRYSSFYFSHSAIFINKLKANKVQVFKLDDEILTFKIYSHANLIFKHLCQYVIIKTTSAKYITLSTMKDMARLLEGRGFARTHRSYIVNMDKIHNIKGSNIIVHSDSNKMTIPVGRAFKKDFRQSLAA